MKRLLSLLTVVTFVAIPNYSYAQNADLVLEEVVVTATKKQENVQDIAQTVNAVTGSTLDDYQIRDLGELSQVVSGVEFTQIDPRRSTIVMRGLRLDPDGGNDQPIQGYIDEMPVRAQDLFYQMYDTERVEVLKGSQGTLQGVVSTGGALHIYTRDAQVGGSDRNGYIKTTFADNNTSILEVASDVHFSDTLALRVAAVANNNDGQEITNIRTGVNQSNSLDSGRMSLSWQPSDELSIRFKYQNTENDQIYPQPVAGSNGVPSFAQVVDGYVSNVAMAEAFGLAPAGSAAQLTFLRRPTYDDIPATGLSPEDGIALHYQNPRQNNSATLHNLMIDYDMGSHALALRFSDSQNDAMGLIDRDYAGSFAYGYPQEVRTNTGIEVFEARISNQDSDKLEYTIGFFSRDSKTLTDADLEVSQSVTESAPGMLKPLVGFSYKTPHQACIDARANPAAFATQLVILTCLRIDLDNKTEAMFANFKYNISDKTYVQFGIREQELTGFNNQMMYLPVTAALTQARGGGLTVPRIAAADQNSSNESTTGNLKIGHYFNEDLLLYVSTETGYRSPGFTISPIAVDPSVLPFLEEESDMTEIGMKGTFMDGRLRLNVAYYDYAIENFQGKWDNVSAREYTAAGPGNVKQVQGGIFANNDATITGLDVEYAYVVNENLVLGGSFTSTDSEYDAGSIGYVNNPAYTGMSVATADVSGTPVSDAAESSLTFYLDHSVPAYWGGERYTRYNVSWRDERSSAINPDITIKALYLANIILGWRSADEAWDASFFVKNITDDVALSNIQGYFSDYSILGGGSIGSKFYAGNANMGRQMGAQLVYNF